MQAFRSSIPVRINTDYHIRYQHPCLNLHPEITSDFRSAAVRARTEPKRVDRRPTEASSAHPPIPNQCDQRAPNTHTAVSEIDVDNQVYGD